MLTIPSAAEELFIQFSPAFTKPTFQRIVPLVIGAIITMGRRTVTSILWTMRTVVKGHWSTYHRVFAIVIGVMPHWLVASMVMPILLRRHRSQRKNATAVPAPKAASYQSLNNL